MARQARTTSEDPTDPQPMVGDPAEAVPPVKPSAQRARELWQAGSLAPHDDAAPEQETESDGRLGRVSLAIVALSAIATVALLLVSMSRANWTLNLSGSPGGFGLTAALGFFTVACLALHLFGSNQGMFGFAHDSDAHVSAAHLGLGLWMLLLGAAFTYFLVHSLGMGGSVGPQLNDSLRHVDVSYLIIVGASALTVVVRTAVAGAHVQIHRSPDVADIAFVLLNLVAMGWFVGSIYSHHDELPVIPGVLVGLVAVVGVTHALAGVAEAWAARTRRKALQA